MPLSASFCGRFVAIICRTGDNYGDGSAGEIRVFDRCDLSSWRR